MEFDEDIREFLIESNENLAILDREIVQLEQSPEDMRLISSVFRTIHTIKGTCGFFGYEILGSVTHVTESILDQVREGERTLTPELISLVLEAVDEIKSLLGKIESTGSEGENRTAPLRARLTAAYEACPATGKTESPSHPLDAQAEPEIEMFVSAPVEAAPHDAVLPTSAFSEENEAENLPVSQPTVQALGDHGVQASATSGSPLLLVPNSSRGPVVHEDKSPAERTALKPSVEAEKDTRAPGADANVADSTIRVDVALLNRLMNLVGELVLARNQLLQDAPSQAPSMQKTAQRLNLITSELQEGLMKTRMQPVGVVWNKLPRVVRDLASKCGKKILIEMDGAGTELDKTIIEAIKDPLTHIVRNSCDHGIETPEVRIAKKKTATGTLTLRAYHEGGVVNIEISDDGAGIDPERVKAKAIEKGLIRPEQAAQMSTRDALHLIFMPGFSTAEQVTSISGRGVGMDVVKTNIEKIGGNVEVMNRAESGTTIRIKIPLTLAIIPGLVVTLDALEDESGVKRDQPKWKQHERFIIPQANLLELVRLEGASDLKRIENVHSTPVFHHRGKLLPLVYLGKVLGRAEQSQQSDVVNIIVLQAENRQMGLVVDRIWDTQEIVVKPLGRQLKGLSSYVGATIMGDGRPALILDVAGISRLAGLSLQTRQKAPELVVETAGSSQSQMILLFSSGRHERLAVPLALVDRLEEISKSKIEKAAGRSVLHYRGEILPLIALGQVLDPGAPDESALRDTVQLVVFRDGKRSVGLMVDQILDIVNESIAVRRTVPSPGLLGSAVIGGKITDLIDLHSLVEGAGENWLKPAKKRPTRQCLLLVDPSPVAREMITEFLDISGYEVIQAGSFPDALIKVKQTPVDLVLTAVDLANHGGAELLQAAGLMQASGHIPIVGLLDYADQKRFAPLGDWSFADHVVRSERGALLRSVSRLTHEPDACREAA